MNDIIINIFQHEKPYGLFIIISGILMLVLPHPLIKKLRLQINSFFKKEKMGDIQYNFIIKLSRLVGFIMIVLGLYLYFAKFNI